MARGVRPPTRRRGDPAGSDPKASVEIVDARGQILLSPSPSFATADVLRVDCAVPLADFPPGACVLRVTLSDGIQTAVQESELIVR